MLAEHGGVFLVAWGVCLIVWSLPLFMFEFALGRAGRTGPVGASPWVFGPKATWRGAFTVVVALGLLAGTMTTGARAVGVVSAGDVSLAPGLGAIFIAAWVVVLLARGGLHQGVSRAAVFTVFGMLVLCAVWTSTLSGAEDGLRDAFDVRWSRLGHGSLWFDALAQSSWSLGAGLGLMTCSARAAGRGMLARRESFATAFSLSVAALLSTLVLLPLQSLAMGTTGPAPDAAATFAPWLPGLTGGATPRALAALFSVAVVLACLATSVALLEMLVRSLGDRGVPRRRAIFAVGLTSALVVAPSAAWPDYLATQDWVWHFGLVIASGLLIFSVVGHGANRFWIELIGGPEGRIHGGGGFRFVAGVVLPLLASFLGLGYVLESWDASAGSLRSWLTPWGPHSLGACIAQWGLVAALLKLSLR